MSTGIDGCDIIRPEVVVNLCVEKWLFIVHIEGTQVHFTIYR